MNAAQQINQDSGNTEYYTPANIIEASRATMGEIDFDPFSCEVANRTVKAARFFTKEDGDRSFNEDWFSGGSSLRVWMNHPFSRAMNARCIERVIQQYSDGKIGQACCITFAATSEKWFRPLLNFPQCFLSPRTNYFDANGNKVRGVTKGSVVTYLGGRIKEFRSEFSRLGVVKAAI